MTFVGQARLPQTCACTGFGVVCVALEVDPASGRVVGLGGRDVLPCCGHLVEDVLRGQSLDAGLEPALLEIQQRFVGPPLKAVCTAIANAYDTFLRHCRQGDEVSSQPSTTPRGAAPHPDGRTAS